MRRDKSGRLLFSHFFDRPIRLRCISYRRGRWGRRALSFLPERHEGGATENGRQVARRDGSPARIDLAARRHEEDLEIIENLVSRRTFRTCREEEIKEASSLCSQPFGWEHELRFVFRVLRIKARREVTGIAGVRFLWFCRRDPNAMFDLDACARLVILEQRGGGLWCRPGR